MKNASQCAKELTRLLKSLKSPEPPELPGGGNPVAVLVQSVLMCEASTDLADGAYERIGREVVDFNDLRVCLPHETMQWLGRDYPLAVERCQQLRNVLNDIFLREHGVHLDHLREYGKRDVKKYIEGLDGISPYTASRVMLLCFQTHAIPVDEQLRQMLIEEGAADESADVEELSSWLARQIKASDGIDAHLALQAWVDAAHAKSGRQASSSASSSKKSTRKTSTKRAAG